MSRRTVVALAITMLLVAGCSTNEFAEVRLPVCGAEGASTTFLMAQAVPDAALIPCIAPDAMPASWFAETMRIDSEGARLTFVGDVTSDAPQYLRGHVEVLFGETCDVTGAVSVPSDEQGAERFEHVESVDGGYVGQRSYVFDGGCVVYRFDAPGEGWSRVVHDASTVWTFMPRGEVVGLRDVALDPP